MLGRGCAALLTVVMAAGVMSGSTGEQAAATLPDTTASATFAGGNGRIAYVKHGPGLGADIFSVRPDGTGNKRLTFPQRDQTDLVADRGTHRLRAGGSVWVMRADGSGKERVTDGQLVGWMPAGGRILVARGLSQDGVDPTWWLHKLATGDEEQLPIDLPIVAGLDEPYADYSEWSFAREPALSPDGELLAVTLWRYDSDSGSGYDYYHGSIFTVRLDGTGLTRIPFYTHSFGTAEWAPGGGQLVFWAEEPRGRCSGVVTSVRLDGSGGSVGISQRCAQPHPAWSPDGRRIVFTSGRSDSLQIASKDGSLNRNVLRQVEGVTRTQPDWRAVPQVGIPR